MCGKFSQLFTWADIDVLAHDLAHGSGGGGSGGGGGGEEDAVTPMRDARVLHLDALGTRRLSPMRWGLPDLKATRPMSRPRHMHARAETIDELPTFRGSFARRRGIAYVRTFNEGEELPTGKTRQWVIRPRDGRPIPIAVIYEEWRRDDEPLFVFVMVTTPANALLGRITDRMPAILRPEHIELWLGETDEPADHVKAALTTFDDAGRWDMAPQPPKPPPPKPQQTLF